MKITVKTSRPDDAYAKPIVVQVRLDEKASVGTHDRVIRVRIKNEEGEDEG